MGGRTKPPYPEAFRQQIVELVASGREVGELAREFNVNAQSIHNWVKKAGQLADRAARHGNHQSTPGGEGGGGEVRPDGHDPQAYLKDVMDKLPTWPNSRIDELLPHHWAKAGI